MNTRIKKFFEQKFSNVSDINCVKIFSTSDICNNIILVTSLLQKFAGRVI